MIKQGNNNAFSFSIRVWFLSITIGLIALFIFGKRSNNLNLLEDFFSIIQIEFFVLIFTIPIFFIFFLLNNFLFKSIKNIFHLKLVINLFVAFGYLFFILKYGFNFMKVFHLLIPTALIWKIKIINESIFIRDDIIDHDEFNFKK